MAISSLSFPQPQAFSEANIDWSPLANLGNVFQQAQDRQRKLSALQQLGADQKQNALALIQSGDPQLAAQGIGLQNTLSSQAREDVRYAVTDKRADAELAIRQAAARREQERVDKQDADEAAAAKLIAGLTGRAPPADVFTRGAAPLAAMPQTGAPQAAPDQAAAAPPQTIPPSPIAPSQVTAAPVVDRIANNLTSGAPAESAGISRDQLAELYRNPVTRPIATAFLQKQFEPGKWKYEKLEDGRLVAANESTGVTKDVTPPSASGEPPKGKDQRERDARFADAKARGFDDTTANYVAINGKLPKEDLSPTEMKAVTDAQKQVISGQDVLDNIARLRELSPTAWSGWGATKRASMVNALLPNDWVPQGAVDTKEMSNVALQNVASQAKAVFGARLAVAEVKLLNEIETTPEMSDPERQAVYTRLEKMMKRHVDAANAEAEGIRNRTYFKPGSAPPGPATQQPSAAPQATLKPSDRIANKARAAIAQGADPRQVRQHMIDNGYDPGDIGQ
jgi:hypothetical protein